MIGSNEPFDFSGEYREAKWIASGGMATIYQARQASLNRYVAVKVLDRNRVLPEQYNDFMQRFDLEMQALAALKHPYIVGIHTHARYQGNPYFVMDWLGGGNLHERIEVGGIPLEECLKWLEQIASALDYAHAKGIIHRDLKPQNVLFDDAGNAILTDFGIAKIQQEVDSSNVFQTQGGLRWGTPRYMAPETIDRNQVDARSDVFALGVILFQMVTSEPPFQAETPTQIMYKNVNAPPPRPSAMRADLPRALDSVILKALAKKPEDRYQSAGELARAFRAALERPTPAYLVFLQQQLESIRHFLKTRLRPEHIALIVFPIIIVCLVIVLLAAAGGRGESPADEGTTVAAEVTTSPIETPTELPTQTPLPAPQIVIELPSATATPTTTRTPTITPSATSTYTPSATTTQTPSPSQTPTRTASTTASPSPTLTETTTPSATLTASATPSLTLTFTQTASRTPTLTLTQTASRTPTLTLTRTASATPMPTATATATATPTATSLIVGTATPELGTQRGFIPPNSGIEVISVYTHTGRWLNLEPVTVRQYRACYDLGGCSFIDFGNAGTGVLEMTATQAQDYCLWQYGGRLPLTQELNEIVRRGTTRRIPNEWTAEQLSDPANQNRKAPVRCLFNR